MFRINPGELKNKIIIQNLIIVTNENGFDEEVWTDYRIVKASINNLHGQEFWSAKEVQAENTIQFIIRYSRELEPLNSKDYRIFWNDNPYNITSIDNIKYGNKWIKLMASEIH